MNECLVALNFRRRIPSFINTGNHDFFGHHVGVTGPPSGFRKRYASATASAGCSTVRSTSTTYGSSGISRRDFSVFGAASAA